MPFILLLNWTEVGLKTVILRSFARVAKRGPLVRKNSVQLCYILIASLAALSFGFLNVADFKGFRVE